LLATLAMLFSITSRRFKDRSRGVKECIFMLGGRLKSRSRCRSACQEANHLSSVSAMIYVADDGTSNKCAMAKRKLKNK
jgi:hypothetical protein